MKQKHKPTLSREDREKRRLKAGKLFKKGKINSEIARKLKVTPAAVTYWRQAYEEDKRYGLLSRGKTGKRTRLTEEKRQVFKKAVVQGPLAFGFETNLWTLSRLAAVMKQVTGVKFQPTYTWEIVRSLGFSPQRPQVLAKARDEQAIANWKAKRLPRLKKMGAKTWILSGV